MNPAKLGTYVLLICAAPGFANENRPGIPFGGTDFKQYYTTSRLLLEGNNPYDYERAGALQRELGNRGDTQVPYGPPTTLLPFLPMGWVDFLTAIQLQMGLNLFLLSVSCWLWGTVFLPKYPLVSLGVIAFWVPTWTLLGLGQVTPWILFGFTGWYFALRNGKPILAGALLNCVIIKPHLGLGLVAYAMVLGICRRQWSMLASFLVTLAVLVTLTFLIRSSVWNEYFASLEVSNPRKWANATLDGWGKVQFGANFTYISLGLCLMFLYAVIYLAWTRPLQDKLGVLLLAMWLAASPYAFSYDFSLFLPAIILSLGQAVHRSHPLALLACIAWFSLSMIAYVCKGPWKEHDYFFFPLTGFFITLLLTGLGERDPDVPLRNANA